MKTATLESLSKSATTVTIAAHEQKTLDLRVK